MRIEEFVTVVEDVVRASIRVIGGNGIIWVDGRKVPYESSFIAYKARVDKLKDTADGQPCSTVRLNDGGVLLSVILDAESADYIVNIIYFTDGKVVRWCLDEHEYNRMVLAYDLPDLITLFKMFCKACDIKRFIIPDMMEQLERIRNGK